jgi:hypothetical protein
MELTLWVNFDMLRDCTVPSIVRCKKMYQTEAMERQNEALPAYKDAVAAQGLAGKVVVGQDHRSRLRVGTSSDYFQYASDGFVRSQSSCMIFVLSCAIC